MGQCTAGMDSQWGGKSQVSLDVQPGEEKRSSSMRQERGGKGIQK